MFYIFKEIFENEYGKDEKYFNVQVHCYFTGKYGCATHSIYNLEYSVPIKNPIVFHNGSNNDYRFILKDLAEEFEKKIIVWKKLHKNT